LLDRTCPYHSILKVNSQLSERELEKRILEKTGRAIADYNLIEDGDRILVALSGGKDSYTLLHILDLLRRKAPVSFTLLAVNVDQGFEGYQWKIIEQYVTSQNIDFHRQGTDIAGILEKKLKPAESRCPLCSRLRRGTLYRLAPELNCTKIALGHHADDLIETLLLNLFFTGQIKSMPARLQSNDGRNTVIRPLAYVAEADIAAYAQKKGFPIICCCCPACGQRDNKQRRNVKELLAQLDCDYPGLKSSMLTALGHVIPSHLLDRDYFED